MQKNKQKKGFYYYLEKEKIEEYARWPVEKRLEWLSQFNELRKYYPKKTIKMQEQFRRGDI